MVFAHFTTIAKRLKTADDWRNDETHGRRRRVLRRRHPLAAHRRKPRSHNRVDRRIPAFGVARRSGHARQEHDGRVPVRQRRRRLALLLARNPVALQGLRLSKLYGRKGIITFESNGLFVLARGNGVPRLFFPGFRDIRGYQAMYRDFHAAITDRPRARDEPRARHRRSAADGRRVLEPSTDGVMRTERYDIIIIGSGAGGGTMAHALADSPARILILERGDFVPQEDENWSPEAVWKQLRYQTKERWIDERGEGVPSVHALQRRRQHEVLGQRAVPPAPRGLSAARAHGRDLAGLADRLRHARAVLRARRAPLPRARRARHRSDRARARHVSTPRPSRTPKRWRRSSSSCARRGCTRRRCRSAFATAASSATRATRSRARCTRRARRTCAACARRSSGRTSSCGPTRTRGGCSPTRPGDKVEAVEVEMNGETVRVEASVVVVSCGAVNSAALLLRSANDKHPNGLANSSGLVGRRYMAHLATMMQGFHPFRKNATVFQKTVAINDFYFRGPNTQYPLGHIQSQGRTHGVMAQTVVPQVPLSWYDWWVARGVDWLAMSEDLPDADNRVTLDSKGRIQLLYRPNNLKAHRMLVKETRRILYKLGFWIVMTHSHGAKNTTHQCGTVVFGDDPRESVLDPYCRAHDVENLFVVDASFFPSSAAVNPGADDRGAGAARRRSHSRRPGSHESSIVQPCRHHGLGFQQSREVLLGDVRLSAGRRRRHAARSRADLFRRRRTTRRRARSAGFACRAAACSRFSSFSRSSRPGRCPGTASG